MNSATAVKSMQTCLQAFKVIALLQLGSHMWPQNAIVLDQAKYDFIIVGAGTAGSVIAARLAAHHNTSVLLIEAGDDPTIECTIPSTMIYLGKSDLDWNYITEDDGYTEQCHHNHVVDLMLGKMLGGTSSLNFLLYSEGYYGDYDNWAKVAGDKIWNWKNVRPSFKKAFRLERTPVFDPLGEIYYGREGMLGLTKDSRKDFNEIYLNGFEEAGNKVVPFLNRHNPTGYTKSVYTIADGIRQSSANYLTPFKDYANLHVLKNTVAKSILFDDDKNAVGVEVVTEDKKTLKLYTHKEVIISAGAINSPKLLMLSGIGPKEHLECNGIKVISDLPVGQNLQDHVATIVIHNMTETPGSNKTRDSREYPAYVITGCVSLNKTKDSPDYCTVNFINYASHLVQFCRITYGIRGDICDAMFAFPNTNDMIFSVVTNMGPKSRGQVFLRSADYTDPPMVFTGYYSDKKDLENQVKYIEDFVRVTNTHSFKKAGGVLVDPKLASCAEYEFGSKDYWRCYALCLMTTRRHYAGTNAIGSVLDSKLKVKGVNKLRVADSSVMPTITRGDTHAPTIMIGEKAADIIKKDNNI